MINNSKNCEWCGVRKATITGSYKECGSPTRKIKLCYFCNARFGK